MAKKQIATDELVEVVKKNPTRVIRTWLTFQLETSPNPESSDQYPHETVPDMTLTIPELLEKHTRGLAIPISGNAVYEEDELPDLRSMDLVDIQELREDIASDIARLQKDYDEITAFEMQKVAQSEAPVEEPSTNTP